jgi:hypothetical protein
VDLGVQRECNAVSRVFALQSAGTDPIASFDAATIEEEFPNDASLDEKNSALAKMSIDGVPLLIKRTVKMPSDRATFTLKYDISNTGESSLDEFQLIQYADFDDSSTGFWDDVGGYNSSNDIIYVRDSNSTAFAGFKANKAETNHHIGAYPGYNEVANDALNNADRYPQGSGSGDAVVAKEWSFGTLGAGESVSITLQFGAASSFDSLENHVKDPETIPTDPPGQNRATGSATTITLLPGGNEQTNDGADNRCEDHNDSCDDGGDKLDSSIPDYWGSGLDAWFLADKRESLPEDRDDALALTKTFPEYGDETFRAHRAKNHITISFPTENGTAIADWDDVKIETRRGEPPYVAVEGEDNAMRRLIDDPPNEHWEWFEGRDKAKANTTIFDYVIDDSGSSPGPRSVDINKVSVGGVEGVRASAILGGTDAYINELNSVYNDVGAAKFMLDFPGQIDDIPSYIVAPTTFYTFLDLIVMADGTTVARVWDTSPYPQHFLYLQGTKLAKHADNGFKKGTGKSLQSGKVDNGVWVRNQDLNRERFTPMVKQTHSSLIEPFSPHVPKAYQKKYDHDPLHLNAPQDHPVMTGGEDGDSLTATRIKNEFDTPLFPWKGNL